MNEKWRNRGYKKKEETSGASLPLSDRQLLDALLGASERLSDEELRAFDGMREQLGRKTLSPKQRQWADRVYDRLELEANRTLNLMSTGQAVRGNVPTYPWELNRPLRPPGK